MGEAQVLAKLTAYALANGYHFTFTHKRFFLSLLEYALSNGEETGDGLRVCLSEADMSVKFSISLRMVIQSLKVFSESGILLRQENDIKAFPWKPYYTIIRTNLIFGKE
jgi:hypothetical protein